ncbi:MAG: helix-turn-helix domain-containing protein [Candidatus Schekmanbacteria bacterium]|nr:helix-turn-helix domain-containing protein [Candidatus Schekmanbacteria bacterium]
MEKIQDEMKSEQGESGSAQRRAGRRPVLGEEDRDWICQTLEVQPSLTLSELKLLFQKERGRAVGRSTLGNCLP